MYGECPVPEPVDLYADDALPSASTTPDEVEVNEHNKRPSDEASTTTTTSSGQKKIKRASN